MYVPPRKRKTRVRTAAKVQNSCTYRRESAKLVHTLVQNTNWCTHWYKTQNWYTYLDTFSTQATSEPSGTLRAPRFLRTMVIPAPAPLETPSQNAQGSLTAFLVKELLFALGVPYLPPHNATDGALYFILVEVLEDRGHRAILEALGLHPEEVFHGKTSGDVMVDVLWATCSRYLPSGDRLPAKIFLSALDDLCKCVPAFDINFRQRDTVYVVRGDLLRRVTRMAAMLCCFPPELLIKAPDIGPANDEDMLVKVLCDLLTCYPQDTRHAARLALFGQVLPAWEVAWLLLFVEDLVKAEGFEAVCSKAGITPMHRHPFGPRKECGGFAVLWGYVRERLQNHTDAVMWEAMRLEQGEAAENADLAHAMAEELASYDIDLGPKNAVTLGSPA